MGRVLTPAEVLAAVPQQQPFRFIDEILEIDDEHIVAAYRFREDADFYRGHFPGNPLTPGVLLIETMAQAAVVAQGIYLLAKEASADTPSELVTVFADCAVEFAGRVRPGDRVLTAGRKQFFRRRKLRAEVEMTPEQLTTDSTLVRGLAEVMRVAFDIQYFGDVAVASYVPQAADPCGLVSLTLRASEGRWRVIHLMIGQRC